MKYLTMFVFLCLLLANVVAEGTAEQDGALDGQLFMREFPPLDQSEQLEMEYERVEYGRRLRLFRSDGELRSLIVEVSSRLADHFPIADDSGRVTKFIIPLGHRPEEGRRADVYMIDGEAGVIRLFVEQGGGVHAVSGDGRFFVLVDRTIWRGDRTEETSTREYMPRINIHSAETGERIIQIALADFHANEAGLPFGADIQYDADSNQFIIEVVAERDVYARYHVSIDDWAVEEVMNEFFAP